jgi:hypothetical protein
MKRPHRVLFAALPVVMLLASCSAVSPPPVGGGVVSHPDGSDVVVQVEWTGGFVPYEYLFTSLPLFTLLGDGRVIVQGPVTAIYPGPALPNLQVRRLTEEGVQAVLFRLTETGLFDENHSFNGAAAFVADANTTVFTMNSNGQAVVVDVYALGTFNEANPVAHDVPADEVEAHARLTTLQSDLGYLEGWVEADDWADAAWSPYQAEALRLLVTNVDNEPPNPEGLDSDPLPWPAPTAPDAIGEVSAVQEFRCGVVSGDEAITWTAALANANQLTRWSFDGHLYRVTPRPLLPNEPLDCGPNEVVRLVEHPTAG